MPAAAAAAATKPVSASAQRPPTAYHLPLLAPESNKNLLSLLRLIIIFTISGAAISSRLFAVVRHESIIHEFDPWCKSSFLQCACGL